MTQTAMDLALLTGLRQGDLLPLEKRHLTDEGIDIVTANNHKRPIIEWSPELRGVIQWAFIFAGQGGQGGSRIVRLGF
jgi:integrase